MAKKDNIEVMAISPELQISINKLQALKEQVDIIGLNCQQIQIVDETSLAIGQQNLSKANNLFTLIETNRKAIKEPYHKAGVLIDSTAKSLSEGLSLGIKHIKEQVGDWEKKRQAEAKAAQDEIGRKLAEKAAADKAEQDRKDAIRAYIRDKATPLLQKIYSECTTVDICNQKLDAIVKNYKPIEWFKEYGQEAYDLKDNYVNLIKAKREQLTSVATMSDAEIDLALEKEKITIEKANMTLRENELRAKEFAAEQDRKKKEEEAAAEISKQELIQQAELNKTKGIRYTWGHELSDIKAVPLDWLTLDDAKVKEWLKVNKDRLKDGDIVDGVKFIKRMGVSA